MNKEDKKSGKDYSPNSLICDYNTFVSAELFFEPVFAQPIWDSVHCLANIIEATILSDEIILPFPKSEPLFSGGQILNKIRESGVVKILDIDSEPVTSIRHNIISSNGKQVLHKVAEWMVQNQSKIENFDHYFPIFACNTWSIFDHDYARDSKASGVDFDLWGEAWGSELASCVSDFEWGFGSPPRSILMPQLAMYFLLRGFIYNELSKEMGLSYLPHPFRAAVVLGDALLTSGVIPSFTKLTSKWMNNLRDELIRTVSDKFDSEIFELEIPSLFTVVLSESSNVGDVVQVGLQIRDTKSARHFRKWAATVTENIRKNRSTELTASFQSLGEVASNLKKELGIERTDVRVSLWVFSVPAKIPRFLHKPAWIRPHLRFIRDTVRRSFEIISLRSELERLGIKPENGLPY